MSQSALKSEGSSSSNNNNINSSKDGGPTTISSEQREGNRKVLLRCTVSFVKELCTKLDMQLVLKSTALVYLHRFVYVHGLENHDRWALGCACVFLAAKVEEAACKLDKLCTAAQTIHDFRSEKMRAAVHARREQEAREKAARAAAGSPSSDQALKKKPDADADDISSDNYVYRVIREKVLLLERVLLHSMSFDVSVTHSQHAVMKALNLLRKGSRADHKEYRTAAWNFIDDAFYTDVCIRFRPDEVAAAVILMALGYFKEREDKSDFTKQLMSAVDKELQERRHGIFDLDRDRLETIFKAIYGVYEASPAYVTPALLQDRAREEQQTKTKPRNKKTAWGIDINRVASSGSLGGPAPAKTSSTVASTEPSSKKMRVDDGLI